MRCLVADQHEPVRAAVRRVLADLGCRQAFEVPDGKELRAAILRETPNIVVVDVAVPHIDVIEMVRNLRRLSNHRLRRTGIVLLAAGATPDLVRSARDAGVDEMVCKPFSVEQIRLRLLAAASARREFIVASNYVGPCRRRFISPLFEGKERRDNDDLLKPPGQEALIEAARAATATRPRA